MTKTTNLTAAEFAGLQAEANVAERLCSDAKGSIEEKAAGQRVTAASNAILSAALLIRASWLRNLGSWSPNRR